MVISGQHLQSSGFFKKLLDGLSFLKISLVAILKMQFLQLELVFPTDNVPQILKLLSFLPKQTIKR